jgi:hypothetical protein
MTGKLAKVMALQAGAMVALPTCINPSCCRQRNLLE